MAVIVIMEPEASIGREIKQTLDRFQVLDLRVVQLIAELPILQDACAADIYREHQTEDTHVPERQAVADVSRPKPHYFSSSLRRTNPRPRTVCSSFTAKRSS